MARVVVIFAILSLITAAMFWLARLPNQHSDVVTTLPVAATQAPSSTTTLPAPDSELAAAPAAASGADAVPPAEVAASSSVPPLPTSGPEANILQQSTTTSGAQTGLIVEDVQAKGDNSIALRGRADPGATVKISVNDKASGEVIVGTAGSWSITVDKGKAESEPKIGLELVAADGKVLDKTNFVFKTVAAPPLSPQDHTIITAQGAAPKPEQVHEPRRAQRTTLRVRRGESLWRIAKRQLGSGKKWRRLYALNKDRIGDDPDYIRPGTRLILPS